jgi:hypothetical protein
MFLQLNNKSKIGSGLKSIYGRGATFSRQNRVEPDVEHNQDIDIDGADVERPVDLVEMMRIIEDNENDPEEIYRQVNAAFGAIGLTILGVLLKWYAEGYI